MIILMQEIWKKYKLSVNKFVMWTVKQHWLWLVIILGLQYISGQVMSGEDKPIILSYSQYRLIHIWNAKLIVLLTIGLAGQKLYLWLSRKGII